MGFFDDTDTAVVEQPEAPKTSGSFFEDTDTSAVPSGSVPSFFDSSDSYEPDPRASGVDEVSVAQGSEPTSNVFADLGRRLGAGTAESGLDTAAGLLKYESDVSGLGKKFNELGPFGNLKTLLSSALQGIKSKMDTDGSSVVDKSLRALDSTPSEMFMGAAQEMRDLSERSKSDYKVDPKRDQDFASKVASGAGSLIPVIASGPAAPLTMAGMMGEAGRKDAEQSGATKAQQDVSFYANAAVGAISEGIMGMPALLRSIKAGKITEGAAKEMATSIATQAVKSYAREGSQEAIEQAAGNAVAKWVAAYDPEREITEGVEESFLVGGAIGAPTGALFQAAENFSTPKKIEEAVETETAADVVDETLRETALSAPPPPVTPQSTDAVTLPSGSTIVMEPQEVPASAVGTLPASGVRHVDSTESKDYLENGGWKLHLTVKPENYQAVDEWLDRNHPGQYKLLSGGDPGEKDFTIYVGGKSEADAMAARISDEIGGLIDPSNAGPDDAQFNEKVAGRFSTKGTKGQKSGSEYYGRGGIPYDKPAAEAREQLQAAIRSGDEESASRWQKILENHERRIAKELADKFGSRFSGDKSEVPQQQESPTPELPEVGGEISHPLVGTTGIGVGVFNPSGGRKSSKLTSVTRGNDTRGGSKTITLHFEDGTELGATLIKKEDGTTATVDETVRHFFKPSEVPQQQESQTPQEPPKVVTKDDVANAIMPFRDQAVRLAESMGSMGNVEADNIVDDAISALMTKVDEGDFSSGKKDLKNPRALLMSFVQNKVLDLRKARKTQKRGGGNVVSMEGQDIENAAVETKGPRQETVEKEDLEQLKKAIGTFTPTEKKVGMMLADEMTVEEIAEELGMAVGSVKNIRTRLAQELGPYAQRMGYGKSLGPGAASADEDLVKYSMRKFAERFQEDESIHEDIRNQSGENYYEPIPFVQTGKEAGKIIEEMGEDKVANQITDSSSDITFAQRVVIGIELLTRLNERYKKERDSNPVAAAQTLEKAIVINEWLKQYGTSLGQGVANFKQWGKRLKLHRMISAMQAANGGAPLSSDQMDFINEIENTETETEERLDDRITALEEEASLSHSDDVLSDRLKDQEKPEPLVLSIAERIEKIIQRNADAARARIRDRLMHARSGFDPVVAYDVMWLAAEQISKGIRKLSDWRKYAKNEFGEDIEPYIDQAWEDANAQIDKMVEGEVPEKKREPVKRIVKKMTGEEVREELTKRITREAKEGGKLEDMVPLIRRLADAFIASGIRTRDPLVDALHAVIEPILPGTTKREVRDAFSGYGRFRELSKDDASQVRRDLSAQSQLVSKYEDIKSGQPLKKSGVERTPTSDEQRRLSKLVEEAKRVHGVKVTDPARQLKSAQDAIKTRLKNEIKDMARQIETGEKPPGKSQTEWDAEIERLKAQRDRIKDVLSSLEDTKIPEETRIKNAERALEKSIEEIQRRIKNKETKTARGTPLESEKLSVLRAQKEVLLAELDELRSADTALQEEKAFDALMKKKDQLEKQIASGDLFPVTKEKPEDTELVKEAREMVNELQKQLADARRSSPESRKAQLDKAIASVESSIKALDARLQAGDLSTKESSPEVTTPELERLRAERAAMVKELNRQRREAAKPSESEAQARKDAKQIENLEKSIAALTQKINAKDLSTKPRKPLSTPEAQKLADYKKYLNDFLNDMRRAAKPKRTAEEVAMKAFKTRTKKEILRLEDRIAKGDFSKRKPKQLDLSKDPEAVKLRARINEVRQRFEKERLLTERKNRTGLQKALDTAKEVLNLPRNMMSSMDFSAVLRQGGMLAFAHPVKAIKALKPMFQSAVSQDKFNELQASIESRPNNQNGTYKEAGLYLAETGDVKLSKKEEAIMSELGDKLPWVKASNRAYVAFLNQMRADSFDVLYEQLKKNGTPTDAELKALGNFVNVATGRGNFAGHNEGAATLALALFSPRLMVSRFQLLMGQPLWKGSARTRTMIAKEYGKAALAVATFSMLAVMAGADYEDDSTSSDFGKLRFGNTRVDPWMGLIQPLVLASRAYHGSVKNGKGKTVPIREDAGKVPYGQARWSELMFKFLRSKLNPTVGGAVDLISGENVVGEKTTAAGTAARMLTPLSIQDMGKVWEEHGMAKGTALNLLGILGMGVQNYEQRSDSKQRALEIMASPR